MNRLYFELIKNVSKFAMIKKLFLKHNKKNVYFFEFFKNIYDIKTNKLSIQIKCNKRIIKLVRLSILISVLYIVYSREQLISAHFHDVFRKLWRENRTNISRNEKYNKLLFLFEHVNVLLNKNKKTKIDLTWIKTTMMIFIKLIYMSTLLYHITRRTWKYERIKSFVFYTLIIKTTIEKLIFNKIFQNNILIDKILKNLKQIKKRKCKTIDKCKQILMRRITKRILNIETKNNNL